MASSFLEVNNITHDYGQGKGAIDISFEVNPGEIVGFLGPNGAGKTTTIRMIMGFIKHQAGNIRMFGKDIATEADLLEAQSEVGYLPADNIYYPGYNTKKLLKYSNYLYGRRVEERGMEIAQGLELDVDAEIRTLSTGNQRKVGVVAAIFHNPKLVILDEPTSGLDPLIQQKVLTQLEAVKNSGGSVFLSSHLLSEVEQICDRIIMIKQGKIVIKDTKENILQKAHRRFRIPNLSSEVEKQITNAVPDIELQKSGDVTAMYVTDTKPVLEVLAKNNIYDFYLERPTLEEMFLNEYK